MTTTSNIPALVELINDLEGAGSGAADIKCNWTVIITVALATLVNTSANHRSESDEELF